MNIKAELATRARDLILSALLDERDMPIISVYAPVIQPWSSSWANVWEPEDLIAFGNALAEIGTVLEERKRRRDEALGMATQISELDVRQDDPVRNVVHDGEL